MKNKLLLLSMALILINACKEDDEAPPRATANFDFNTCDAPCTVNFINISQNANSYSWNFGDGSTSTEVNPKHLYENAGTYNVKLDATGEGGSHTREKQVVIASPVFLFKYKANGTPVEANLFTATRNSPQGFMDISSSGPGLTAPFFSFYIKEPSGGFANSFNVNFNLNSAMTDSTVAAYTNDGATIYSTATDVNGVSLNINYLKYELNGIVSGTFSGTLKTSSGTSVQITEGSLKVMFNN